MVGNKWNSFLDVIKLPPTSIFLVDGKDQYEQMKENEETNKAINECLDALKVKEDENETDF